VADEFDVRIEDGRTIIGVIQRGSLPVPVPITPLISKIESLATDDLDLEPAPPVDLKPLPLESMPNGKAKVHILAATDPWNISVRLCSWDPMPDYLYSALAKDFSDEDLMYQSRKKTRVVLTEGTICVAKLPNGSWERVTLVRPSKTFGERGYWIVYAVDVGVFHCAHQRNLQPLSSSVSAFDKVLLAKCRLAGVKPANGQQIWSRNAQQAIQDWLRDAQDTQIEMIPADEWTMADGPSAVPSVTASLIVNGEDLAEKLVAQGFAQAD